jgi:hypothetical protein
LLAKEKSYKVFYKAFFAKEMFEKYISKNYAVKAFSDLKRDYSKPKILIALCK